MPPEGISRREYRTRKFGSWERSLELDRRVAEAGAPAGIAFAFDRMERTPNTFAAHRLLWLAERAGVQDAIAESLFTGYFLQGEDVGDPGVLLRIGIEAGLNRRDVEAVLTDDSGAFEVRAEEAEARHLGVDGVPFFVVSGRFGISGAQRLEVFRETFRRALAAQPDERFPFV
jgi:predicted DsbA family dithiol-disulfide isomerase